jgi:hypothetical protein
MASRRKRGPVALRHQLWLVLPLFRNAFSASAKRRQFWEVPKLEAAQARRGRVGSVSVIRSDPCLMTGIRCLPDIRSGRIHYRVATRGQVEIRRRRFNSTEDSARDRRANTKGPRFFSANLCGDATIGIKTKGRQPEPPADCLLPGRATDSPQQPDYAATLIRRGIAFACFGIRISRTP